MTGTSAVDAVRVDGERLWRSLMDLAKIGATPKGGCCRLTLTAEDGKGRDLVVSWACLLYTSPSPRDS